MERLRQGVSILGQNIRIVRPELIKQPIIRKDDRPVAQYDTKPRTREIGVAEFFRLCLTHPKVRERR